jgi:hypothetical protein
MNTKLHFRVPQIFLVTIFSAILGSSLFLSCSEGVIDDGQVMHYSMMVEAIPEAVPVGVALYFPLVVRLESPDGSLIPDSLLCEVWDPEGTDYLNFYLYDDGNAFDHPPANDFLSLRSGDIVPGDGRFTRQITGQNFAGEYGIYKFAFVAPDGGGRSDSIEIRPVEVPFFTEITPVIAEFPSGFEPVEYQAHIQKPTPGDRIDSVHLEIPFGEQIPGPVRVVSFHATSGDTVWSLTLMPAHFSEIRSGVYDFDFVLWDRFGLSADTSQNSISITNGAPVVFNSTLPDTIWRPRLGEPNDTTAISVQVDDPESLMDIAEVRFEVRKVWQDWQSSPDFYLLDLGGPWDAVAGDGIYSVPLVTSPSDSLHDTLYYFRFYARDKADNRSDYLLDSVRVIERPGVTAIEGPNRIVINTGNTGAGVVL